jgi:hypothetical protein
MSTTPPPPDIQVWLPAVATFASGLIGGLVALGVTWMTHTFTASREVEKRDEERKASRAAMLRGKLEDLMSLLGEHLAYQERENMRLAMMGIAHAAGRAANNEQGEDTAAYSLNEAKTLVALYFPDLDEPLRAVKDATEALLKFRTDELDHIARGAAAWGEVMRPTFGTRGGALLAGLARAIDEVAAKARQLLEQHDLL